MSEIEVTGETSDGYHTFNELYDHRMALTSIIVNQNPEVSWKSKKHSDGSMFDGMFIVGIDTPSGTITYHYNIEYWDLFHCTVCNRAPEWDGHQSQDVIDRLIRWSEEIITSNPAAARYYYRKNKVL